MAILVDDARWWFRGERWAHLVSDHSLDELHRFAEEVGIPRIGFQGDHYDVPERMRDDCIAAGAIPSDSRRLVRALRRLGLRPRRRRSSST